MAFKTDQGSPEIVFREDTNRPRNRSIDSGGPCSVFKVYDPWVVYEQEKKKLPVGLTPDDYTARVLEISNKLYL